MTPEEARCMHEQNCAPMPEGRDKASPGDKMSEAKKKALVDSLRNPVDIVPKEPTSEQKRKQKMSWA